MNISRLGEEFYKIQKYIIEFSSGRKYFNIKLVRDYFNKNDLEYSYNYIKQELHNLCKKKAFYNAGYSWYSTLPQKYQLDTSSLEKIIEQVNSNYPFLTYSIWTTRQLIRHYHHIPTKFVTFIYMEREAMEPLRDFFLDANYEVYLNPYPIEIRKSYFPGEENIVLRPGITEEPVNEKFATIEKILVDLFVEKDKLYLMDEWEYRQIFKSITDYYRINIALLLRYSQRRKVKKNMIDFINPLTSP